MTKKRLRAFTVLFLLLGAAMLNACQNGPKNGGYKSINGTQIYYRTMGQGEPIIVIHGGPVLSQHYLVPHLKPLAKKYKLVYYDQRLSGRSSADVDTADITMKNFVDDIEGLRKSLNLEKVIVMGHSWGGLLAMQYAIHYPQHIKKLILADPMPASAQLWQQEEIKLSGRKTEYDRKKRQQILNSEGYRKGKPGAIEALLKISFKEQFHDTTKIKKLDLYVPHDYENRSRLFGHLMPDLQNYNLFPELEKVQVPTLILYGSDEPAADLSGKKLVETMPNAQVKIINQSGHFPFIEQPEAFFNDVRTFLN